MKSLLFSLFGASSLALVSISPADATADISCRAVDGRSGEIYLNVARSQVLSILSVNVSAFGKTWSTLDGSKNKVIVGQAFDSKNQMLVDLMDENAETILISLRTTRISTNKESGEAGVLRIGEAVYPVKCGS